MHINDYRELVKRYNPPKVSGLFFAYAVNRYAKLLQYNQLGVAQCIVQLYKDKRLGLIGADLERPPRDYIQHHTERSETPEVFYQPNISLPWIIAGIAILGLVARLISLHL